MSDLQFAVDAATKGQNGLRRLEKRLLAVETAVVLTMRRQGQSMRLIAKETGIQYGVVRMWCRNHGL